MQGEKLASSRAKIKQVYDIFDNTKTAMAMPKPVTSLVLTNHLLCDEIHNVTQKIWKLSLNHPETEIPNTNIDFLPIIPKISYQSFESVCYVNYWVMTLVTITS